MTKNRLEFLSDGVFAIVMTLLMVEVPLPKIESIGDAIPDILAYFLSFALLANLWTIHTFLFSIMSQNTTRTLASLNIVLLSFISLIPFSTSFLATYPDQSITIAFYSIHILILSLLSLLIREFISFSPHIQNPDHKSLNLTPLDKFYGTARIVLNIATCSFAVIISTLSTSFAIILLLIPVVLGIIPGSLGWLLRITHIDRLAKQ